MEASNVSTVTGYIGRDPDVQYYESGTVKARFSVACRGGKDKEGNEITDWVPVEVWGKTAEIVANYVKKGSLITVLGKVKTDKWDDKNSGETKYRTYVAGERLTLLGGKPSAEGGSDSEEQSTRSSSKAKSNDEDDACF